ncbi:MAG: LysE family translocator, partial [Solirubrobacteraceae bacterium]
FVGVAALVIVTPGPDTALTVRNALLGGRRAGVATAAGVALGLAVWTAAASAGLAALLVASEPAFVAVKLAGAAYLVLLGAQTLLHALRGDRGGEAGHRDRGRARLRPAAALRQGLLNDLGNPKIAVFFTTLLPQFAPAHGAAFFTLLGLGLLFCAMTFAWLCAYSAAVARAGDLLRRPRLRRAMDAVMGAALVAVGVRVAVERR